MKERKTVVIDTHEPSVFTDWFLQYHYNVENRNIKPSGDFQFQNVIIERKTVADFDASFMKYDLPNMWDQCQRMVEHIRENEGYAYIIVVGDSDYDNQHSEVTPASRIGAVGSILVRYGIPITFVATEYALFKLIDKIFRSHAEGKAGEPREYAGFKKAEGGSIMEGILMKCSGVSMVRAKQVVDELNIKRLHDICSSCTIAKLEGIKGIGSKTAEAIRRELGIDGKPQFVDMDWTSIYKFLGLPQTDDVMTSEEQNKIQERYNEYQTKN